MARWLKWAAVGAMLGSAGAALAQDDWPQYGGGMAGTRFAASTVITPVSISGLERVWIYQTGDATDGEGYFGERSSFKATPLLFDGEVIFSTGFNRVHALNPTMGDLLWRFDPETDFSIKYSEMFTSRGVVAWRDPNAAPGAPCAKKVFLGTLDARLIAIDVETGRRCADFAAGGEIDLSDGVTNFRRGEYSVTSPPTVVNGMVVVGSSVGDNGGVELDSGIVRGFDARTGQEKWRWDPIPRTPDAPGWSTWENGSGRVTGAAIT